MPEEPTFVPQNQHRRRLTIWMLAIGVPCLFVVALHIVRGLLANSAWTAIEKKAAAAHCSLRLADYMPKPIPDDRNFFGTPALKCLAVTSESGSEDAETERCRKRLRDLDPLWSDYSYEANTAYFRFRDDSRVGRRPDLRAVAAACRQFRSLLGLQDTGDPPRDLLAALQGRAPLLAEIAAGNDRPFAVIQSTLDPAQWDENDPLGTEHWRIRELQAVEGLLLVRAQAAVGARDYEMAIKDTKSMLRLSEAILGAPGFEACHHMPRRVSCAAACAWSALYDRPNPAQVKELAIALDRFDFERMTLEAIRAQAAMLSERWPPRYLFSRASLTSTLPSMSDPLATIIDRLAAVGSIALNRDASIKDLRAKKVETVIDYLVVPTTADGLAGTWAGYKRLVGDTTKDGFHWIEDVAVEHYLGEFGPDWLEQVLLAETQLRQARIACALELYYARHHSYPSSLEQLVPEYCARVPADLFDQKPMRYERSSDRYKLWSIGPDEIDDGGLAANDEHLWLRSSGPPYAPSYDIIWSYDPITTSSPGARGRTLAR